MLAETFITRTSFCSFLNNLMIATRFAFVKNFLFDFEPFLELCFAFSYFSNYRYEENPAVGKCITNLKRSPESTQNLIPACAISPFYFINGEVSLFFRNAPHMKKPLRVKLALRKEKLFSRRKTADRSGKTKRGEKNHEQQE